MRAEGHVLVVPRGGLGNQMFQYAAARAAAARLQGTVLIDPKIGFQTDSYRRQYGLDAFRLSADYLPDSLCGTLPLATRVKHESIRKLESWAMRYRGCYYLQPLHHWFLNRTAVVGGYFQSPTYFESVRTVIRSEYRLRQEPARETLEMGRRLVGRESIGVHIRLGHGLSRVGDTVSRKLAGREHRLELLQYYRSAVALVKKRVTEPCWLVTVDTPDFEPDSVGILGDVSVLNADNGRNPAEDIWLLSQCTHKIIARSTFSWWAAWLSDGKPGIVCAPRVFTPGGALRRSRGIYPEGWITL